MKSFILSHALNLITAPIIGLIVYAIHENLQRGWLWLDQQGPLIKRAVAFVLAAALTPLASVFGASVPQACADASGAHLQDCFLALGDQQWLGVVVGGAVALVVHKVLHPTKLPPE